MSGICGFVLERVTSHDPRSALEQMVVAMKHRGEERHLLQQAPWFAGRCWRQPEESTGTAAGQGPIKVWILGALSNAQEVLITLPEAERPGPNATDSEVIAALWRGHGVKMAGLLKGHVALALMDTQKNQLYLVRDRFGLHNLYFAATGEAFCFSSELRSLMRHPATQRRVSPAAVRDYLVWGNVPAPDTMFEGVQKLEAGTWLLFQPGGLPTTGRYWDYSFASRLDRIQEPRPVAAERLGQLLSDSLLPLKGLPGGTVGTIVSASHVSLLVTSLLKQVLGTKGFGAWGLVPWTQHRSRRQDDSLHAISRELGLFTTFEGIEYQTLVQAIPTLVGRMNEPNADPQVVPFYCQTRLLEQKGVRRAVIPEGLPLWGVDIPEWSTYRLLELLDKTPKAFRRGLYQLVDALSGGVSGGIRARDLLSARLDPQLPRALRAFLGRTFAHPQWARSLLAPGALGSTVPDALALPVRLLRDAAAQNPREAMVTLSHRLSWNDSAAARIETVAAYSSMQFALPLADEETVDYIVKVPWQLKERSWWRAALQDLVARKSLPAHLLRKHLPQPLELSADGFTGELKVWIEEMISPRNLDRFGFLDGERVRQLWRAHLMGETDARRGVWAMLVLLLWLNEHAV